MKVKSWLKGKKTYLICTVYCVMVMVTGQVPEGTEDAIAGFDIDAIKEALIANAFMAAKASWNRYTESS